MFDQFLRLSAMLFAATVRCTFYLDNGKWAFQGLSPTFYFGAFLDIFLP
jgi:hypothetical protein